MASVIDQSISVSSAEHGWCGRFTAMASDCEVLVDTADESTAHDVTQLVADEAWRVERKFSRYRDDSVLHKINTAGGQPVTVDEETARLLDFGAMAYQLSEGKFDLSSGVMREIWRFDGSNKVPTETESRALLSRMGWQRANWQAPNLALLPGMEIDFGGIGKEYAVDQAAELSKKVTSDPVLVNFGGDLYATKPPVKKDYWLIGMDQIGDQQAPIVQLKSGGLATSGDSRRFLLKDGVRYPHVLNPLSAWPVMDAPNSVTVAANSCVEAGLLATLAMLEGLDAEEFLRAQEVLFWVQRG